MTDYPKEYVSTSLFLIEPGDRFPNVGIGGLKASAGEIEILTNGKAKLYLPGLAPIIATLLPDDIALLHERKKDSILYPEGYIMRVNPETGETVKIGNQYIKALEGNEDADWKRMCLKNQIELPANLQPKRRPPFTPFEFGIDCRIVAELIKRSGQKSIAPRYDDISLLSKELRNLSKYKITAPEAVERARDIILKEDDKSYLLYNLQYADLLGKNYNFLTKRATQELTLERMALLSYLIHDVNEKKGVKNTQPKKYLMTKIEIPNQGAQEAASKLVYDTLLNLMCFSMKKEEQEIFLTSLIIILAQFVPDEILNTIPGFSKEKFKPSIKNMTSKDKELSKKISFNMLKMFTEIITAPFLSKLTKESIDEIIQQSTSNKLKGGAQTGGGILSKFITLALGATAVSSTLNTSKALSTGSKVPGALSLTTMNKKNMEKGLEDYSRITQALSVRSVSNFESTLAGFSSSIGVNGTIEDAIHMYNEYTSIVDQVSQGNPQFQNYRELQLLNAFFRNIGSSITQIPYSDEKMRNITTGNNLQVTPQNIKNRNIVLSDEVVREIDEEAAEKAGNIVNKIKQDIDGDIQAQDINGVYLKTIWPKIKPTYEKDYQDYLNAKSIEKAIQGVIEKLIDLINEGNIDDPLFKELFSQDSTNIQQAFLQGIKDQEEKNPTTTSSWGRKTRVALTEDQKKNIRDQIINSRKPALLQKLQDMKITITYKLKRDYGTLTQEEIKDHKMTFDLQFFKEGIYKIIQNLNIFENLFTTEKQKIRAELIAEARKEEGEKLKGKKQTNVYEKTYGTSVRDDKKIDDLIQQTRDGNAEITEVNLFNEVSEGVVNSIVDFLGKVWGTKVERKEYAGISNLQAIRIFITIKATNEKYFFVLPYAKLNKLRPIILNEYLKSLSLPDERRIELQKYFESIAAPIRYDIFLGALYKIRLTQETSGELNKLLNIVRGSDINKIQISFLEYTNMVLNQITQNMNQITGSSTNSSAVTIRNNNGTVTTYSAEQIYTIGVQNLNNLQVTMTTLVGSGSNSVIAPLQTQEQIRNTVEILANNTAFKENYPLAVRKMENLFGWFEREVGRVGDGISTAVNSTISLAGVPGAFAEALTGTFTGPYGGIVALASIFGLVIVLSPSGGGMVLAGGFMSLTRSFISIIVGVLKSAIAMLWSLRPGGQGTAPKVNGTASAPAPAPAPASSSASAPASASAPTPNAASIKAAALKELKDKATKARNAATKAAAEITKMKPGLNRTAARDQARKLEKEAKEAEAAVAAAEAEEDVEPNQPTEGGYRRKRKTRRVLKKNRRTLRKKKY